MHAPLTKFDGLSNLMVGASREGLDSSARRSDQELLWLADDFLLAPLPLGWTETFLPDMAAVFYVQASTGTSQWEHPSLPYYRDLVKQLRALQHALRLAGGDSLFEARPPARPPACLHACSCVARACEGRCQHARSGGGRAGGSHWR
jgi:hypothetical protein